VCCSACCNTMHDCVGRIIFQRDAVCCSVLPRVALCCSVLQCVAVTWQIIFLSPDISLSVLQFVSQNAAVHFSIVQCVAA